jgi:hypothetical protein
MIVRLIDEALVLMTHDTVELLHSFREFLNQAEQGATIPAVEAQDLKSLHELCVERAKRYCGKDGVISLEATARACSSAANVPAVWLRHTQLRALYRYGMLAEWQHGTELEDAVFRLAATIPMSGVKLDEERFVEELRQRTKGLSC